MAQEIVGIWWSSRLLANIVLLTEENGMEWEYILYIYIRAIFWWNYVNYPVQPVIRAIWTFCNYHKECNYICHSEEQEMLNGELWIN